MTDSISTPPAEGAASAGDNDLADAFRALEGHVCDAEYMGLVTQTVLDDVLDQRRVKDEDRVEILLTLDQENALVFAMNRLVSDLKDLKGAYYRGYGEESAAS